LKAWGGKPESFAAGQKAFARRAKLNGMARNGSYTAQAEQAA
jgi:fructose-bisphosphate aldolase class I